MTTDASRSDTARTSGSAEAASDEPLSFDALYRQHRSYIGTVALRVLGDAAAAEDVVQETFISAYRAIGSLRNPEAARAWLARIAVRQAHHHLRKRKLKGFVGLDRVPDYRNVARGASPEQQAVLARIYQELDRLPSAQRIAWTLRYLEGEKLESVAEMCGCSLATAKRRIRAAHQTIQEVMDHG
ncbi:MAG: RNA polymerase sigma factor [Myxococcota bacterium]